ncbi:MAG TPA: hypothetical protein VKB51_03550 [bacterium]|nr:hypothetical protein [bacterium]
MQECSECRRERYGLDRSLAVFRQFASQPAAGRATGPSWEQFSQVLAASKPQRGSRLRFRVPLAAASLLVAVSSGLLLWPVTQEPDLPQPAKIVNLQPEHQAQLQSVLHSSLLAPATTERVMDAVEPQAMTQGEEAARATLVDDTTTLGDQAAMTDSGIFGQQETERAPVLLFRSLQQQRAHPEPIPVMPVFAPVHTDSGSLLPRGLLSPRPIR